MNQTKFGNSNHSLNLDKENSIRDEDRGFAYISSNSLSPRPWDDGGIGLN
jgi:hypothetical protein